VTKLMMIVGFLFVFSVEANDQARDSQWKVKGREVVSSLFGTKWAEKIFGPLPKSEESDLKLPEIQKQIKKGTDAGSYTKKIKPPTEFDKLSLEKKRQFDFKFLQELFLVTRRTEAKDEDLAAWMNTLDQGGSREGIYQALVLDEVYATLENIDEKPTTRVLDFSLKFSQRFLNETFKKEALEKLNSYSIKRILTEKGLDLMEYYEVNSLEDLYLWYAFFSAELAKDYSPMLKTDIRKDERLDFHLTWARNMPIQHIKSEFVIKLHSVINQLQLLE
jgi:hypothetical protein